MRRALPMPSCHGSVACLEAARGPVFGVSDLRGEGKTLFDGA